MAKREEFNPNEILDDVTAVTEDEFDILGNLPQLNDTDNEDEMDDLFGQDFLSMLGMEDQEPAEEVLPEELAEEAEAPSDEDEDVKEYTVKPMPAFDVEPELDEEFIKSVEEIFPETEDWRKRHTEFVSENISIG